MWRFYSFATIEKLVLYDTATVYSQPKTNVHDKAAVQGNWHKVPSKQEELLLRDSFLGARYIHENIRI